MEALMIERVNKENFAHIKGWGIDINPENDPTYPIKERTDVEQEGYSWERPDQQPVNIEVLHSIERPNVSAVFGTAAPPKGISGAIRRFAFKYSESSYRHWLPLLLADRIDVVEGLVEDISKGYFPNILAERGMKASWKYNRNEVVTKAIVATAVLSAVAAVIYINKLNKNNGNTPKNPAPQPRTRTRKKSV